MREAVQLAETRRLADLRLLITPEPWSRNFLQNLGELFRRNKVDSPRLACAGAAFWPDVFVDRRLPWRRFLQSGTYHFLALVAIWEGSQFLALQPNPVPQPTLTHVDVIYYTPLEYLAPLDTGRPAREPARGEAADPEYSAQPVISVPPESNNRSQTIVTAPRIRLQHNVSLPNIVAWKSEPQVPIGPVPVVLASETSRLNPRTQGSVVAPPPDVQVDVQADTRVTQDALKRSQPAVIAPPPAIESKSVRLGDLNIEHSTVIAPAPQLSLAEQRTLPDIRSRSVSGRSAPIIAPPPAVERATGRLNEVNVVGSSVIAPAPQLTGHERRTPPGKSSTPLSGRSEQIIAPPPSLVASARTRPDASIIALSLHPAVGAPAEAPAGNRRGNFAATPEGHQRASGAAGGAGESRPAASVGSGKANGSDSGSKSNDLPSGLYVGKSSSAITSPVAGDSGPTGSRPYSVNPNLIANARPPRVSPRILQPESESKLSAVERPIFGNRKFYSLSLNMPNLNSAGGSWIIRFAALKGESDSAESYSHRAAAGASPATPVSGTPVPGTPAPGDLSAPSATRKVDPAYPLELMRQHLGGTVILYAVIHANGTVGNIRVLRSVDERLDQFASEAIAKWQFEPATKNGAPVDVEATFWIPFQPARVGLNP